MAFVGDFQAHNINWNLINAKTTINIKCVEVLNINWNLINAKTTVNIKCVAIGIPHTTRSGILDMEDLISYINGKLIVASGSGGGSSITPEDIWNYTTRTLTQGTRDNEIDDIKAKVDQIQIEPTGEILAKATNTELQNLDASISSRASQSSLDNLSTMVLSIPQLVWEYTSRTLTSFGSLISDIWGYATRTLTSGTRDAEIDSIKTQIDKLQFNQNGEVLAEITNTELQNLDAPVSSRASQSSVDSILVSIANIPQLVWEYSSRTLTSFGTLISDIWSYVTRTLTTGTKDQEIDSIKSKVDQLQIESTGEVRAKATNSELQNLDVPISSRASNDDIVGIIGKLNTILDIEQGNWEINPDTKQMIFYDRYGVELMRFNLYDRNGNLSDINVYKRERVD